MRPQFRCFMIRNSVWEWAKAGFGRLSTGSHQSTFPSTFRHCSSKRILEDGQLSLSDFNNFSRRTDNLFAVVVLGCLPCMAFSQDRRPSFPEDVAEAFARLTTTTRTERTGGISARLPLARWERPVTWTVLGKPR